MKNKFFLIKLNTKALCLAFAALLVSSVGIYAQVTTQGNNMIDLPPLPSIDGDNKGFEQVYQKVQSVNAIEQQQKQKEEFFKSLLPWRGGFGDPRDPNFQQLLMKQFPMSPDQMKIFRETLDVYEEAIQDQVRNPTPIMSTRSVNLDPGSAPPPVRISTGYVSSILFVDETGAPWPIKAYDIGNSQAFNIVWDKVSNLMMIQGLVPYSNTNMVVLLHNLETPVIINLVNDQKKVDYRLDLRIPGLGPKAATPIMPSNNIPSSDNLLMGLIDGIPPERAKPLTVSGGAAKAWLLDDEELLIRTRLTILSPSYTSSMRSPDGMKVYRMPKTPLVMAAKDGGTYQLAIKGY